MQSIYFFDNNDLSDSYPEQTERFAFSGRRLKSLAQARKECGKGRMVLGVYTVPGYSNRFRCIRFDRKRLERMEELFRSLEHGPNIQMEWFAPSDCRASLNSDTGLQTLKTGRLDRSGSLFMFNRRRLTGDMNGLAGDWKIELMTVNIAREKHVDKGALIERAFSVRKEMGSRDIPCTVRQFTTEMVLTSAIPKWNRSLVDNAIRKSFAFRILSADEAENTPNKVVASWHPHPVDNLKVWGCRNYREAVMAIAFGNEWWPHPAWFSEYPVRCGSKNMKAGEYVLMDENDILMAEPGRSPIGRAVPIREFMWGTGFDDNFIWDLNRSREFDCSCEARLKDFTDIQKGFEK